MPSIMSGPLHRNPVSDLAQLMFYHILFSSSKITGWAGLEIRMTMSSLERFFPAAKLKDFSTLIQKNTRHSEPGPTNKTLFNGSSGKQYFC